MNEAPPNPHEEASEETSERLYEPAPGELQLTARAIVVGILLGGVVAAMNIYFGLKTGWGIGGSLIAAILGYSVFAAIKPKRPYTVLEANITQTAGSAAGSMTSAAGLLSAVPALGMLGYELSPVELTLWALSVAYLGVFYAVPLRRQMVLVEKLRFPTGTATAETIIAMFTPGGDAIDKSRALLRWGIAAAVFTLAAFFISPLGGPPLDALPVIGGVFALGAAWSFSLIISPLMTGAGILIGPRVATSLLAGAVVSWAVIGPLVQAKGWAPGAVMSYSDGVRGWILWPGVAIMVADALTSLALSWRTVLNTFTARKDETVIEDPALAVPNTWWIGGLIVASIATVMSAWLVFGIPPHLTVIAVALSWVLATIAVRSTGETDINPLGGMGKVTQLVFGGLAPGAMSTNLMAAAISSAGASQAGDMMQDLKTGHLLGAAPRPQVIAQLIGVFFGVFFCVPIYLLFDEVYEIGGEELPAPAAHAWRAMAELLAEGFGALPPGAVGAVIAGLIFGSALPILRKLVPSVGKYLPSALAFGIAFIVPALYSVAMFIGALLFMLWKARSPDAANKLAFAVASGLIAGEGLMGVLVALLQLFGVQPLM